MEGDLRIISTIVIAGGLALAGPGLALGPVAFGPSLSASGWQDFPYRNLKQVEFTAEGADTLRLRSDHAASLIWRQLPSDFSGGGVAQWRWKVDQAVPPTDLSDRGADDRSIALYFLFADSASAANDPPKSMRSAMMSGRALIYVWGSDEAAGSVIRSPSMFGRGQLVVQRPAASPTNTWISESVDLRADFRRAFGREPGPLVGVGVSADSDNTGTVAEATLSNLVIR
jgi:hypothetical protein